MDGFIYRCVAHKFLPLLGANEDRAVSGSPLLTPSGILDMDCTVQYLQHGKRVAPISGALVCELEYKHFIVFICYCTKTRIKPQPSSIILILIYACMLLIKGILGNNNNKNKTPARYISPSVTESHNAASLPFLLSLSFFFPVSRVSLRDISPGDNSTLSYKSPSPCLQEVLLPLRELPPVPMTMLFPSLTWPPSALTGSKWARLDP